MTSFSRCISASASRSGIDRPAAVIDDEALAEEPADRDAVLEERVHPRIRVRVVGRRRTVDGVAAGVRRHGHDRHAVGEAAVDRPGGLLWLNASCRMTAVIASMMS